MTNLPPTHQDVLCLLSQALHATRLPESTSRALNNHPDWPAILREAAQQAVLPLVLEAALTLPPDQQPPGGVLAIYRDQAIRQVINNERLMAAQDKLLAAFEKAKIPCLILKGSSAACRYPRPELRVLGDIDLLVGRESVAAASGVLESLGYRKEKEYEPLHIGFNGSQAFVELHFEATEYPDTSIGEQLRAFMADALRHRQTLHMHQYIFPALDPVRQAVSLVTHIQRHMRYQGIGLRHLCDFAVFVHHVGSQTWQADISGALARCGMLRFAEALAKTCVVHLGLPQSSAPWCAHIDRRLADDLVLEFLASGNFGIKQPDHRLTTFLSVDRHSRGKPASMPRTILSNLNRYARNNFPATRKAPVLLPMFWIILPAHYALKNALNKKAVSLTGSFSHARRRKKLFDQLRIYQPDKRANADLT